MKYIFLFTALLFTIKTSAQNCNCGDNFKYLTQRISKNYVGYSDKINVTNKDKFIKFTDSLQQIATVSDAYRCLSLSREWLDFFKDKHISFGLNFDKLSTDSVKTFFKDVEKTQWSEALLNNYLKNNANNLDSLEGIWNHENNTYKIGIIRDQTKKNQEFIGFIIKSDGLRWLPQQVKFRVAKIDQNYRTMYFGAGDHSIVFPKLIKSGDTIDFGFFGKWRKGEYKPQIKETSSYEENLSTRFVEINDGTSLLALPSFNISYKHLIDSLIEHNKEAINNTKHLIIDVRDNAGGSTNSFKNLLPYLYTNPIKVDGGKVLATEENIRNAYDKEYPFASEEERKSLKEDVKKLRSHLGELYLLYKPGKIRFKKVLKNPERISILMNRGTASSSELFILRAEQSKKVTLFGENTAGIVDYGEIVKLNLPCSYLTVAYPASKSLHSIKRPLDNIGIAPQVKIPANVTDWIDFVRTYKK
ncbi:S41 family peptidase [Pedobacter sp. N23S346]|uniref:S41 family peptidase n=1 Tax=Pedobacter sp. N23S346 TaxID=3402750 RepID=UPI003AC3F02B